MDSAEGMRDSALDLLAALLMGRAPPAEDEEHTRRLYIGHLDVQVPSSSGPTPTLKSSSPPTPSTARGSRPWKFALGGALAGAAHLGGVAFKYSKSPPR